MIEQLQLKAKVTLPADPPLVRAMHPERVTGSGDLDPIGLVEPALYAPATIWSPERIVLGDQLADLGGGVDRHLVRPASPGDLG
jgi:hypothetical protein